MFLVNFYVFAPFSAPKIRKNGGFLRFLARFGVLCIQKTADFCGFFKFGATRQRSG